MNNIYKLIIIFPFLILGCKPSVIDGNRIMQKIDSLDMNIYSNQGEKIYRIISPNSTYDILKQTISVKKTTINLFNNNELEYIINSDESKLSNNNKIIELKGNVKLKNVLQDNDILYSDYFIWKIDDSEYLLKGNIKFENENIILNSNKAILNSDNIIEFFNPVKYIIKKDNKSIYEINSENAFYNIKTKAVSFKSKNKRVRTKLYF
tara:strand:- start:63 stop:683 length:621 start_codon:yes stop_codon:yes gene_type:complete